MNKKLKIEYIEIDKLIPYINNPVIHTEDQINKIANSIKNFGFINPIIIDKKNEIIAGHGRLLAAKKLELEKVPVLKAEYLTSAQVKAYRLADNQLTRLSEWDKDLLSIELESLQEIGIDIEDIGFEDFGFKIEDIEITEKDDEIPEISEGKPFTHKGDLWVLGEHRLLCDDSRDIGNINKLVNGKKIKLIFNDPPFDLGIDDIYGVFKNCLEIKPCIQFWLGSDKQQVLLASKYYDLFSHFFVHNFINATLISNKQVMQKHNIISKFGNTKMNNLRDGFSTIIDVPTMRVTKEHKEFNMGKNINLPGQFISHYSENNDIIVDLFGGYGSTLIACEKLNRKCYMMEIKEDCCDMIIRRYYNFVKRKDIFLMRDDKKIDFAEIEKKLFKNE